MNFHRTVNEALKLPPIRLTTTVILMKILCHQQLQFTMELE